VAPEARKRERMESRVVIPENEKGCGGGRGNLMTLFYSSGGCGMGPKRERKRGGVELRERKRKE